MLLVTCLNKVYLHENVFVVGIKEDVKIEDNNDGTYTVDYTPTKEGTYQVQVLYADQEVPRSPYRIRVLPTHDASKVGACSLGLIRQLNGRELSF